MRNVLDTDRYEYATISELSDAELDVVAAAGQYYGTFAQVSLGNIAVGVQVNNQVNVAVLSFGSTQGGNQSNFNNAGNVVTYGRHF